MEGPLENLIEVVGKNILNLVAAYSCEDISMGDPLNH
jgi:hypothetical protein